MAVTPWKRRFEVKDFLIFEGLPSRVDEPHLPTMRKSTDFDVIDYAEFVRVPKHVHISVDHANHWTLTDYYHHYHFYYYYYYYYHYNYYYCCYCYCYHYYYYYCYYYWLCQPLPYAVLKISHVQGPLERSLPPQTTALWNTVTLSVGLQAISKDPPIEWDINSGLKTWSSWQWPNFADCNANLSLRVHCYCPGSSQAGTYESLCARL